MLNDYKIRSTESLNNKKVVGKYDDRHNGLVIEHIFENFCVVKWQMLLKNKIILSIESIKDLRIQ